MQAHIQLTSLKFTEDMTLLAMASSQSNPALKSKQLVDRVLVSLIQVLIGGGACIKYQATPTYMYNIKDVACAVLRKSCIVLLHEDGRNVCRLARHADVIKVWSTCRHRTQLLTCRQLQVVCTRSDPSRHFATSAPIVTNK